MSISESVIKPYYMLITVCLIKTLLHVDHSHCFYLVTSSATHFVSVTNACSEVKNRNYIYTVEN